MSEEKKQPFKSAVRYFDKYRLDIDNVRKEAVNHIEEMVAQLIRKEMEPPSPRELIAILPQRIKLAMGPTLNADRLSLDDVYSLWRNDLEAQALEWDKREKQLNEVKYHWMTIQDMFVKKATVPATPAGARDDAKERASSSMRLHYKTLLERPSILDSLPPQDILALKTQMEAQLIADIPDMSGYERSTHVFVNEWKDYQTLKVRFKEISDSRIRMLHHSRDESLSDLETQYREAKMYVRSLERFGDTMVNVKCMFGGYDLSREYLVKPNEHVSKFIVNFLSSIGTAIMPDRLKTLFTRLSSSSSSSSAGGMASPSKFGVQAVIEGGPRMIETLFMRDYNLHIIKQINIIFMDNTLVDPSQDHPEPGGETTGFYIPSSSPTLLLAPPSSSSPIARGADRADRADTSHE